MTSFNKLMLAVGLIGWLLSLSVYAQSAAPALNHFAADGISFDYPAGYSLADESTQDAQQFVITRKGSSVLLTIIAMRRMVQPDEMPAAIENFRDPIVKNAVLALGQVSSPGGTPIATELGAKQAEGVQLRSSGSTKKVADVIWLRSNFRLIAMTFIRSVADETAEAGLWETVRSSLKVEAPVVGVTTDSVMISSERAIRGGVLNGKALALPKPAYPDIARAAHAQGTVLVQVLIDENGDVVAAHAVSGHPLLQAACVAAARQAKFSPTKLAGEPVKVTGVIQYNFVAR